MYRNVEPSHFSTTSAERVRLNGVVKASRKQTESGEEADARRPLEGGSLLVLAGASRHVSSKSWPTPLVIPLVLLLCLTTCYPIVSSWTQSLGYSSELPTQQSYDLSAIMRSFSSIRERS